MLFITLLLLKVFNIVTWSWWIITAPLWFIPTCIILFIIIASIFEYAND